ncbi:sterol carrier protein [Roseivivax marinus]|jgi:putative sterol carrier protein|uniref:Sterol carrier protein n=1 Tax=Roseivivax marinus TaxID=1379903 RepID=W4HI00_9RHOB|nr:SCP2 sterol-binding domain-containing protein [Roseivivax marinus]ETW12324.1 sterol carrier protein [Roseivivax marinus]UMA64342.1 SCP2 sterol-binding domain-containing protein [Roseivivax marinus]SEK21781.1 Putative sterol carrier protein [Roseivivax marinus]
MTLQDIADKFQRGLDRKPLSDSIKFDCGDDGAITLDGDRAAVADAPADCTIRISRENLDRLIHGKLNPMTAFATGKIKVSGDMSVAMKLAQLLR